MLFKACSYFMMVFFSLSVILQYNDPDWLVWMAIYGIILISTIFLTVKAGLLRLHWPLIGLALLYGYGVFLYSDGFLVFSSEFFQASGMKTIKIERARELWGLIICFSWTIILIFYNSRATRVEP